MAIKVSESGTMITGEHISVYRLITLKTALKMEILGMRMSRGRTAYSIIKQEFGLHGSKRHVLEQFEAILEQVKSDNPA